MLPELHAERQLLAIEAASVPQMKDQHRAAIVARYQRRAERTSTTAMSAHEALQAAGIPVRQVPAQKPAPGATGQAGTTRKAKHG